MKFNPENHIVGKVYDLTQENMNAMLIHIDTLEKQLDEALTLKLALKETKEQLKDTLAFIEAMEEQTK